MERNNLDELNEELNAQKTVPDTNAAEPAPNTECIATDGTASGDTAAEATATKKKITKKDVWETVKLYLILTLGSLLYSLGISLFITPADLSAGGMTGISIIFSHFIPLDHGILLVILNIPMLIIGLIVFGWKFLVSTGYATISASLLMSLWTRLFGENGLDLLPFTGKPIDGTGILINAVVGGVLFGVGMGLIFRMGASTAGTDVIVKLLRKKFRYLKTGAISLITDMIIVCCSLFVTDFNITKLFFTALSTVVFTLVFDWVLYGGNSAKTVFIITDRDKFETICARILKDVDTGATVLEARGAYTQEDKIMIMCVVKPLLYPKLRDVVREEDKKAFMIVSSAKEIYGEGYKDQNDAEL